MRMIDEVVQFIGQTHTNHRKPDVANMSIEIFDETWQPAKVIDPLSTQFTAEYGARTEYYFYADKGLTWRET